MTEKTPRKRTKRVLATLILGETMAVGIGATGCPPLSTSGTPTPTATRTSQISPSVSPTVKVDTTPQICDAVPPPPTTSPRPGGTATAPTRPTTTSTPTASATPRISTPASPTAKVDTTPQICDAVPPPPTRTPQRQAQALPLRDRLLIRIQPVAGERHTYRFEANFAPEAVQWKISGGTLQSMDNIVVWQPPAKRGRYLLQAIVDAGPAGVAIDALVVEA